MKTIIALFTVLLILGLAFSPVTVQAADVPMKWEACSWATGYKIYKSEDGRSTWDTGLDVGSLTDYTYLGVREDAGVDFRVSAYDADKEIVRYWSGAWYDHRLKLSSPGGTGIE